MQFFLPLDTDLGHLICLGHWNANGHDACYQEFKAGLPPWASVTTITRTGSGPRKLQDTPAADPGLPPPPQPPENEMKPLQPTYRPLRINNCRFKILGFHYFQGRNTDADTENGHMRTQWGRRRGGMNLEAALMYIHCCSDSVRPHRRQPTRLPRPWDSPGKNTGEGCHFLLQHK